MTLFTENNEPVVDPAKNYLEELVGEGKKFKTIEDLARSKVESDNFITRLQTENAEMRKDLTAAKTIEDLYTKLDARTTQSPPVEPQRVEDDHGNDTPQSLNQDDLEKLIEGKLTARETARVRETNIQTVERKLQEEFGANYRAEISKRAKEMNLDTKFLTETAERSPEAFFKILDIGGRSNDLFSQAPPASSIRQIGGGLQKAKTFKDFEKLRRENPTEYWKPATQNEMYKLTAELGEEFFK